VNTAIVLFLITDFNETLSISTIEQIKAVLIADAFTTPLLRLADPFEAISQLFVSKLSLTQEKMNSYFYGQVW